MQHQENSSFNVYYYFCRLAVFSLYSHCSLAGGAGGGTDVPKYLAVDDAVPVPSRATDREETHGQATRSEAESVWLKRDGCGWA